MPEPRNQQDNLFLDSLATDMFVLGINDKQVAGHRVFDSDQSTVIWFNWAPTRPRERDGHCVAFLGKYHLVHAGYSSEEWFNLNCESEDYFKDKPKSLVCQRSTRK